MRRVRPGAFSAPRAARIAAAGVVLIACAYGFAASGPVPERAVGAVAAWQLFPLLARSLRAAAEALTGPAAIGIAGTSLGALAILVLSAIFGRWYCAALCPLGSLQGLALILGGCKKRFRKSADAIRVAAFVAAASLPLAGAMAFASYLDPWSIFGRFMSNGVRPLAGLIRREDLHGLSAWGVAVPAAGMAAVLAMAVLRGRWFCNVLCPVGGLLGLLNRFAPFRVRMEDSACVSCGACERRCPASCIDASSKRVDSSRCVNCLACVDACPAKALRYGPARGKAATEAPMSRRRFLISMGSGTAALALAALPGKALASALAPARPAAIPPGAVSLRRFLEACTACGLCSAACPSKVLQPSLGQLGRRGLFVPRLDFSVSYCQYECKACSDACPSGALGKMSLERKKLTKVGNASLVKARCVVIVQGTRCGACAEHCPTGAVHMVPNSAGLPEPFFSSDICIGCGACHHACPVRPEQAITVAGLEVHRQALPPPAGVEEAAGEGSAPSGPGDFPF